MATKKEWDSILAVNRTLPREKRRFFIESKIREGNTWDRMFIETSKEEYDKWHSQEEMRRRNLKAAERYKFLSLDYGCSFDGDVRVESGSLRLCAKNVLPASAKVYIAKGATFRNYQSNGYGIATMINGGRIDPSSEGTFGIAENEDTRTLTFPTILNWYWLRTATTGP